MRIIVTGNCGFLGSWIAESLFDLGHTIMGVDDLSGGSIRNVTRKYAFRKLDLRDYDATQELVLKFKPEVIYHLAANAREGASAFQPSSVASRNAMTFYNILSAGIQAGTRRFIAFSSIAAYGAQRPPFREVMPLKPVDIYGLQKAQIEQALHIMAEVHEFEYVIARPHNIFGERQALDDIHRNVIGIWMNQIMRGEPLTIYGDGSMQRAFSPIYDSIGAYTCLLAAPSGSVYNIGSDMPMPLYQAADLVKIAMGAKNHPVKYLPERHKEVKFAYCDHHRAHHELGLPFGSLERIALGIERMAEWAKKMGPQEWRPQDKLEITGNPHIPEHWKKHV